VFVWSYNTHQSDPVVLTFPVRSREPSLATLVSPNAGSHEPGLVLVKVTGQIAYWDAVGSAVAEGLIQRAGVQTSISLSADESVTYLCNAEPAGFVVATSKGALWDVSTRDSEGRPALSYVGMTNTGGAWLSGLRSFISGGYVRSDIVAVKPGVRGEYSERRDVFVATKRGSIEKWELARGGSYRLTGQGDVSQQMQEILRERMSIDLPLSIVDVAPVPTAAGAPSEFLAILASYPFHDSLTYAIFQCSFPETQHPRILTGTILPPAPPDYATIRPATPVQPQLYVPSPGRSAFIAYSRGFAVISLPHGDADWAYCDISSFREDHANLRVIGSGQEDLTYDRTSNRKLRNPGMMLVVQGAGVVRVESFDVDIGDARLVTSGTEWIQSKIEQAIFYGVAPENPLDFKPRSDWNWKLYDVEGVVTKISDEILTSSTPHLEKVVTLVSKYTQVGLPLEEFLTSKTQSLVALAHYVQSFFPDVSYATRQHLLLDAEKAEAVRKLWQTWGKRLETYDSHERGTQVLEGVVKDMRREATGEAIYTDVVREWFRNEPSRIGELIVRSLRSCQKYVKNQHGKDALVQAKSVLEANEIALVRFPISLGLITVFDYGSP
jgi:nuclear pore complex protein Nup133